MRSFLAVVFAVLLVPISDQAIRKVDESEIREAAFRYQFNNNASGLKDRAAAYYLSIADPHGKETDPSADFVRRVAGNKPPVKRVSECGMSGDWPVVVDKVTGERGLVFWTGTIKWVSDGQVEIPGGYREARSSSSGNTYHLRRVDGKWKVVKDVLRWIS